MALRFVFPEPASGERLHGEIARGLEPVRLIMTFREGGIDRPNARLPMVWERAEQGDRADNVFVRDHFVLRRLSRLP